MDNERSSLWIGVKKSDCVYLNSQVQIAYTDSNVFTAQGDFDKYKNMMHRVTIIDVDKVRNKNLDPLKYSIRGREKLYIESMDTYISFTFLRTEYRNGLNLVLESPKHVNVRRFTIEIRHENNFFDKLREVSNSLECA